MRHDNLLRRHPVRRIDATRYIHIYFKTGIFCKATGRIRKAQSRATAFPDGTNRIPAKPHPAPRQSAAPGILRVPPPHDP